MTTTLKDLEEYDSWLERELANAGALAARAKADNMPYMLTIPPIFVDGERIPLFFLLVHAIERGIEIPDALIGFIKDRAKELSVKEAKR